MKNATLSHNYVQALVSAALAGGLFLGVVNSASADVNEQAKRMYERLAGVPPTTSEINAMAPLLNSGTSSDIYAAANIAMQTKDFYNVTLKNMVVPWTNKDMTAFYEFNDAAATLIGIIRDDLDFRRAMYDNIIYVGPGTYSNSNNTMYRNMEATDADLRSASVLTQATQSGVTGINPVGVAGVLTTRQSARAFFYAGTNRRMLRFTFVNYLCKDLEAIKDTSRIPDRVRQDPDRSPGGDSSVYLNTCLGCHAGMDGLAGAYAYYQWNYDVNNDPNGDNGNMIYQNGVVQAKHLQNSTVFPYGYVTSDDSWINRWRTGPNANFGWGANPVPGSTIPNNSPQAMYPGNGMQSLGMEIASSEQFARCQAIKVYKTVCFNEPSDSDGTPSTLNNLVTNFKNSGYKMKQLFADAAYDCRGN